MSDNKNKEQKEEKSSNETQDLKQQLEQREQHIKKLEADNEAANLKLQKKENVPEQFQDSKVKVIMSSLKEKMTKKLEELTDLATMEIKLPVHVRMKHRMENIKKSSAAQHYKIEGQWKTIPPEFHVSNLEGKKLSSEKAEIRFSVFLTDEEGSKIIKEHKQEGTNNKGDTYETVTAAEYVIGSDVVERIDLGKHIVREVTVRDIK